MVIVEEVALVITLERRVGVQEEGAEKGETTTARTFGGHCKFLLSNTRNRRSSKFVKHSVGQAV